VEAAGRVVVRGLPAPQPTPGLCCCIRCTSSRPQERRALSIHFYYPDPKDAIKHSRLRSSNFSDDSECCLALIKGSAGHLRYLDIRLVHLRQCRSGLVLDARPSPDVHSCRRARRLSKHHGVLAWQRGRQDLGSNYPDLFASIIGALIVSAGQLCRWPPCLQHGWIFQVALVKTIHVVLSSLR